MGLRVDSMAIFPTVAKSSGNGANGDIVLVELWYRTSISILLSQGTNYDL